MKGMALLKQEIFKNFIALPQLVQFLVFEYVEPFCLYQLENKDATDSLIKQAFSGPLLHNLIESFISTLEALQKDVIYVKPKNKIKTLEEFISYVKTFKNLEKLFFSDETDEEQQKILLRAMLFANHCSALSEAMCFMFSSLYSLEQRIRLLKRLIDVEYRFPVDAKDSACNSRILASMVMHDDSIQSTIVQHALRYYQDTPFHISSKLLASALSLALYTGKEGAAAMISATYPTFESLQAVAKHIAAWRSSKQKLVSNHHFIAYQFGINFIEDEKQKKAEEGIYKIIGKYYRERVIFPSIIHKRLLSEFFENIKLLVSTEQCQEAYREIDNPVIYKGINSFKILKVQNQKQYVGQLQEKAIKLLEQAPRNTLAERQALHQKCQALLSHPLFNDVKHVEWRVSKIHRQTLCSMIKVLNSQLEDAASLALGR